MAGYDEYSKSNNAVAAEDAGLLTASQVAKRIGHGATATGVKAVLTASEWHHTSKMYNCTDYFDFDGEAWDATESNRDLAAEIIAASKASSGIRYRANVEWLEWGGSRKHPVATKYSAENIEVEERGDWFIFHFADGSKKRKGMFSAGTHVTRLN